MQTERRIQLDDKIEDGHDIILWYQGNKGLMPVAARGDMLCITGLQKTRKSLLASCIVSSKYIRDQKSTLGFEMNLDLPILHFDTEQPDRRTRINNERLHKMVGATHNLTDYYLYNIRPFSYKERIEFIDERVTEMITNGVTPGCIVIDQTVDLVPGRDYNNTEAAHNAVDWAMRWRDACKALLILVIHTNRGGQNTNGKLGVLIDQLTDSSFIVEYDKQTGISTVKHKESRDKRICDFSFIQNQEGFPKFLTQKDDDFFL